MSKSAQRHKENIVLTYHVVYVKPCPLTIIPDRWVCI